MAKEKEKMQTLEKRPLTGTVALVTGGFRGIGAGIVRRLAADGTAVAFTYISQSRELRSDALSGSLEDAGRGKPD